MEINDQKDIVAFIKHVEAICPVNKWKFNGIHLWPFIRLNLFFFLLHKFQYKKLDNTSLREHADTKEITSKKSTLKKRAIELLLNISQPYKFKKWLDNLQHRKLLFFGHPTYRADFSGKKINKFFDPLIAQWKTDDFYFIEEDFKLDKTKLSYPNHILDIRLPLKYYLKTKSFRNQKEYTLLLEEYKVLEKELKSINAEDFLDNYSKEKVGDYFLQNIYRKVLFHKEILKRINPKKIYVLCYYCNSTQPIIIAAKLLKIEVVEMQHGVQTDNHLAYGTWTNLPAEPYASFPDIVWNWDEASKEMISNSMGPFVKPFVGGNPWLDFFENEKNYKIPENTILYSIQPFIPLDELFPQVWLDYVKNNSYLWYIRLHPRQLEDAEQLRTFFQEKEILDKVNIDDATSLPLPAIISGAQLNVTHSSSTVIEAAMLGKKTVITSQTGADYYRRYIEQKSAIYIPFSSNFSREMDLIKKKDN